ncbi:MAG: zinc transporter ZupT [Verrucomicrobia bacterium]|jgi:zinc transporter, ZIP family|nr:zinc transporter ZupT [Verrucomicrobiota bacterium]MBT7068296.1 zinc transporter ZupT [Verrucomicrobiota bacterium]
MQNIWIAFGLTAFAGLATGIGSIIAFTAKRTNYRFLSVATGFSAGVMLYVSFVEILFKGGEALAERYGDYWGGWLNTASFFGGILLIGLIDNLIPSAENPHEIHSEAETMPLHDPEAPQPAPAAATSEAGGDAPFGVHDHSAHHHKLMRMGLFTALAIGIHNFPEGLATFLAALDDPSLGVAIAVAIALHNIPEGISVSVPIFYATGDRKRAFIYSMLSGVAEPIGAGIGYLAIRIFMGDGGEIPSEIMGILFGGVAGIMVYISLDELLPTSRAYGKGHDSLFGLIAGMLVMAASLLLMR